MLEYNKNLNWTWFLFEGEVSCGNPSEIPHLWQFIGLAFSTTTSAGPFIGEIVQWSRHQVVFLGPKIMHPKRGGKHIWIQSIVAGGAEQKNSSVSCPYWVNFALNRFRRYALPHFLKPWTIFKCGGCWKGLPFFFGRYTPNMNASWQFYSYTTEVQQRVYPWRMVGKEDNPFLTIQGLC